MKHKVEAPAKPVLVKYSVAHSLVEYTLDEYSPGTIFMFRENGPKFLKIDARVACVSDPVIEAFGGQAERFFGGSDLQRKLEERTEKMLAAQLSECGVEFNRYCSTVGAYRVARALNNVKDMRNIESKEYPIGVPDTYENGTRQFIYHREPHSEWTQDQVKNLYRFPMELPYLAAWFPFFEFENMYFFVVQEHRISHPDTNVIRSILS